MHDFSRTCGPVLMMSLALILGCGEGTQEPTVTPLESGREFQTPRIAADTATSIRQWGTWILHCEEATDKTPASVKAIPLRSGEIHVNVTGMLLPPTCVNCMDVSLMGVIGLDWTIYVSLTNPTVQTAYDVTGIFPGSDGPTILEPDSYTDMCDMDGDSSTHNPFIRFETGDPGEEWGPGETHGQTLTFRRYPGEKFTDLVYVVTASWPSNQGEIVELRNPLATGPLYTDASKPANLTVEVPDWQNDIEYVLIDLEPVNGSAFTHMEPSGNGTYQVYSYAAYGLSPGSVDLLMAAKSFGSDYITYNYLTVEIMDPLPPPTYFQLLSGPTALTGDGTPYGELDLAMIGKPGGSSTTLVYASPTEIYAWDEDYSESGLFATLIDTTGGDPDFPIDPISRIAAPVPALPESPDTYSFLQTNLDTAVFDDTTDPPILFENTLRILDLENLQVVDFRLIADKEDTPEVDAILRPADVSGGVKGDKRGYAIWVPDDGAYQGYYPFVALVMYEAPYKDASQEFDTLIGGVPKGTGAGMLNPEDVDGLAVWDGGSSGEIMAIVSEGGSSNEVEIFSGNYLTNPGGELTSVATLGGFSGTPLDVAVLPVGDAGKEDENWICILTDAQTIEVYSFTGDFIESIYDLDAVQGEPRHIDTDTVNMRIHLMMDGPLAAVFEYTGM